MSNFNVKVIMNEKKIICDCTTQTAQNHLNNVAKRFETFGFM